MPEEYNSEIERIKNETKIKNNNVINSKSNNSNFNFDFKNIINSLTYSNTNNYYRYLLVFFSYLVGLFVFLYIIDSFVIPSFVHSRASVIVPNIIGLNSEQGKNVLQKSELKSVISSEIYSSTYPKGYIIKQLPKSGLKVKSNRPIYLTISKGNETVKMPNLINTSLRNARVKLMNLGMSIGVISYEFSENIPKDSIMTQSISAGRVIPYGEIINLIISKGSEINSNVPNLIGIESQNIEEYIKSFGFVLGSVNYRKDETFATGTIIEQFPVSNSVAPNGSIINIVINGN